MQAANIVDVSLARFMIIPTADDYPEEVEGRGIRTAPAGFIERAGDAVTLPEKIGGERVLAVLGCPTREAGGQTMR